MGRNIYNRPNIIGLGVTNIHQYHFSFVLGMSLCVHVRTVMHFMLLINSTPQLDRDPPFLAINWLKFLLVSFAICSPNCETQLVTPRWYPSFPPRVGYQRQSKSQNLDASFEIKKACERYQGSMINSRWKENLRNTICQTAREKQNFFQKKNKVWWYHCQEIKLLSY